MTPSTNPFLFLPYRELFILSSLNLTTTVHKPHLYTDKIENANAPETRS